MDHKDHGSHRSKSYKASESKAQKSGRSAQHTDNVRRSDSRGTSGVLDPAASKSQGRGKVGRTFKGTPKVRWY